MCIQDLYNVTHHLFEHLTQDDCFRCLHGFEKAICVYELLDRIQQHLWLEYEDCHSCNEPVCDITNPAKSLRKSDEKHEVDYVSDVEDSMLGVDPPRVLQMVLKKASLKNMPLHRQLYLFLEMGDMLERNYFYEYHDDEF